MNPPPAELLDLSQRLLAYEASAGNSSGAHTAAFRVCEKLRRPISTFAGATGFYALLARALTLAKRDAPGLSTVQVKPDGSLEGLSEHRDDEAGAMLISQLLGLLVNFIGEFLTLRLVQDAWPDWPFDETNSGGTKLT
jgi:hypothetical protein